MGQSKLESVVEATCNIGSGFILSLVVWQILAGIMEIPMPLSRNLVITSIFTVVSLTRSYLWRRYFNTRLRRKIHGMASKRQ